MRFEESVKGHYVLGEKDHFDIFIDCQNMLRAL